MKYPKVIFSIFLIFVLLWNTFYVSLTYAYYYVDQSGFIEQFCKNIDKPEMKCDGKCHLKNVVEKKTTKETTPVDKIVLEETRLFFKNIRDFKLDFNIIESTEQTSEYLNLYTYSCNYSIDRPPQV